MLGTALFVPTLLIPVLLIRGLLVAELLAAVLLIVVLVAVLLVLSLAVSVGMILPETELFTTVPVDVDPLLVIAEESELADTDAVTTGIVDGKLEDNVLADDEIRLAGFEPEDTEVENGEPGVILDRIVLTSLDELMGEPVSDPETGDGEDDSDDDEATDELPEAPPDSESKLVGSELESLIEEISDEATVVYVVVLDCVAPMSVGKLLLGPRVELMVISDSVNEDESLKSEVLVTDESGAVSDELELSEAEPLMGTVESLRDTEEVSKVILESLTLVSLGPPSELAVDIVTVEARGTEDKLLRVIVSLTNNETLV
ncbi:hypothetical protein F5Y19DRAFT_473660 [Xylariaceae sp. FL1651]|nr:hypothetical protein F5Y19DRAFT_473660 [Xylariaceae sp. FL1651]